MCGSLTFPSFSKSCRTDSDCGVTLHQVDCCGTAVAWSVNVEELAAFVSAERACDLSSPGCGCAGGFIFETLGRRIDNVLLGRHADDRRDLRERVERLERQGSGR